MFTSGVQSFGAISGDGALVSPDFDEFEKRSRGVGLILDDQDTKWLWAEIRFGRPAHGIPYFAGSEGGAGRNQYEDPILSDLRIACNGKITKKTGILREMQQSKAFA